MNVGASAITINSGAKLSIPAGGQIRRPRERAFTWMAAPSGTRPTRLSKPTQVFADADFTINVGTAGGTVETANAGGTHATVFTGNIKGAGNTCGRLVRANSVSRGRILPRRRSRNWRWIRACSDSGMSAAQILNSGFGAAPAAFTPDAITLSGGGSIGANYAVTLNANRGVTLALEVEALIRLGQ